jgi:hypothetical protein
VWVNFANCFQIGLYNKLLAFGSEVSEQLAGSCQLFDPIPLKFKTTPEFQFSKFASRQQLLASSNYYKTQFPDPNNTEPYF